MSRRYVIHEFWRLADGRDYAPQPRTLADRDRAMRLFRRMRDQPEVPEDTVLYVIGPVFEEEQVGSGHWRPCGVPAAAHAVIDKYGEGGA